MIESPLAFDFRYLPEKIEVMRKFFSVLSIITISVLCHLTSFGEGSIPQWIIDDWEFRAQGDGIWVADNSKYRSEEEPFEAYGIEWKWGLGKKSLTGRLYCIQDGKDVRTVWTFLDFWDVQYSKLKLTQVGGDGTVGQGTMWLEEDGSTKSIQNFISPDGSSFTSGHQAKNINDESHISSFSVEGNEWKPRRSYVWKNSAATTKEVVTPEEYENFEFLIGSWLLNIGEDRFVEMSFKWAQNKMMIFYKSTNPSKPGEPILSEVEGVISYHGVKEQLVFMSAYLDSPPTLMNEGHFEFSDKGVIERIFTVFYKEGSGIPWTNGEKAPKGGRPIDFKQVWTKIDEDSFAGEFFWKKNGKWEHPMPQNKDSKKENWKRVR